MPTPSRARSINGSSIEVTWDEPVVARGVIEKYILRAYREDGDPRGPRMPRTPSATSEWVRADSRTGKGRSPREQIL